MTIQELTALQNMGFSITPCYPKSKCSIPKWKPFQKSHISESKLKEHLYKYPTMNAAVITGSFSNVVVLDIDSPLALSQLQSMGNLPLTAVVKSGNGWHYYFRPNGNKLKNRRGIIPKVDFRGENGLSVSPGSVHKNGFTYYWERDPTVVGIADIPDWLADMIYADMAKSKKRKKKNPNRVKANKSISNSGQALCNPVQTFDSLFKKVLRKVKKRKDAQIIRNYQVSHQNLNSITYNTLNKTFTNRQGECYYILCDSKNEYLKKMKKDFIIEVGILLGKSKSKFNNYFNYVVQTFEKHGIQVKKSMAGTGMLRIYPL